MRFVEFAVEKTDLNELKFGHLHLVFLGEDVVFFTRVVLPYLPLWPSD